MADVRAHRVTAFCDWLDTVPPTPPFHTLPAFKFFADLSDAEFDAAGAEMRKRGAMLHAEADDLTALALARQATELGSPDEWLETAIVTLKAASSCDAKGGVLVSQAALHVVLAYVEELEGRLGLIPEPNGAA
jgi:hypothetical protein